MEVIFESRDAHASQMRELSLQRVRFSFRRLTAWVVRVRVQFSDVNGPRGGVDKRCQVELSTPGTGTVVIVSLANDWGMALNESLERATRTVRRSLLRNVKPVRGRAARLAFDS